MQFRPETSRLLVDLQTFSGGKLTRSDDLGTLLELAGDSARTTALEDLIFLAKFLTRIYGIMQRIGAGADGYDKLLGEFNENLTRTRGLLQDILGDASAEVQDHFRSTYPDMTQDGFQNYLALLNDLSWYKNWRLDHRGDKGN